VRPVAGAVRVMSTAAVRSVSFAAAQDAVSPAPWLVDDRSAHVRPLFAQDAPSDGSSEPDESASAEEPEHLAEASSLLSLPPSASGGTDETTHEASPSLSVVPDPRDAQSEAFARAVAEHLTARARALRAVEEQLLDLAVQLAEVLVEHEIARDPQVHAVLARAALAALEGDHAGVVRASPAALAAIVETFGEARIEVDGAQRDIVLDTRLDGLGVVVEGADARVDGRVAERLRSALRAMQDERRRREAEVAT
jgi:Flagellar assembly protein FliH